MKNGRRLLFIKDLFNTYSDKNHSLSISKIKKILQLSGLSGCKNTIMDDIHTLQEAGMYIAVFNDGYRLMNRLFDITEIRIIADAIASFKFLTVAKSKSIIEKLKKLCSKYEAEDLQREFHIANRVKSDNSQVIENIDMITKAMKENKQFSFEYYDYDIKNQMVFNGTRICSPWELAISSEEYYVITYYPKYPTHPTNFRVDRMKNIQIIDAERIKPPKEIDIGKYLKSSFCMFSGIEENVTLRFPMTNKMCNIVYDKFGHDTHIYIDGDDYFRIHVPIKTEEPRAFFSWLSLFEGNVQILAPSKLMSEYFYRMNKIVFNIENTINEIEIKKSPHIR